MSKSNSACIDKSNIDCQYNAMIYDFFVCTLFLIGIKGTENVHSLSVYTLRN